jgi:DNA-binding transcriptional regulator/RsmH inhibitor MraZ
MGNATRLDDRGRLTIRRAYRRILTGRVVQILTPHGVLLRPVPDILPDRGQLPPALTTNGEEEASHEAGR